MRKDHGVDQKLLRYAAGNFLRYGLKNIPVKSSWRTLEGS